MRVEEEAAAAEAEAGAAGEDPEAVPSIEKSCLEADVYRSVVERYYTLRYRVDATRPGDDYCILIHSNRVCVVTLAESHYLFASAGIASVDFNVKPGLDRASNTVSGKWKHGAQRLSPVSALLVVETREGGRWRVVAGVGGKLLEVNTALAGEPGLMTREPRGRGYLAVVLPDMPASDRYRRDLLDAEGYREAIEARALSLSARPPLLDAPGRSLVHEV